MGDFEIYFNVKDWIANVQETVCMLFNTGSI